LFVIALLFSAFFSGSETALISARRIKLEVWMHQGRKGAKQAYEFIYHPERFLTTILVGNNIAIIAASSLLAIYLESFMNGITITAVSSLFLLFFGEILPKSIARDKATNITLYSTFILQFFYFLLYPVIWLVKSVSHLLLKILGLESQSIKRFFTRKDLEMLIRESEPSGLLDIEERGLISRFILRGNQKVLEIMVPRTDITRVQISESINSVIEVFKKTGFSRLPVTGKKVDDIRGIITAKDMLLQKPQNITEVLREALFIPETARVGNLLNQLQKKRIGMAIVVDEYGGTAGLVTLEDIMEEFFGDIQDEFDEEADLYRNISPDRIEVNAKVPVLEINLKFNLNLPEGDYQTIGGLLMHHLGHIPKRGETVQLETCHLTVLSAFNKRVLWVRIVIIKTK
jgi:putative hemolysin